ncbi:ATP-binding protein [Flammeovirga sp. EKP202]|uniref:hybrid sensor histidine kinase/response regulator transcription factor n=1 Tax=Flammeovirga sp. EKP202 TaxID=2770592 RepID=UPI00165F1EE5|nr:ATP-binding protein [Flammeovirga sp. EKP202]MBD0402836.1 response regulator [Flammeovirga sp. EKP202]
MNKILLALLVFFITFNSFASTSFDLNKITVENGLSHSDVRAICQDDYGYIWIATLKGLNFFDGREIKVFDKSTGFKSNRLIEMKKGHTGRLWILTENSGISSFDPLTHHIDHYQLLEDSKSKKLYDIQNLSIKFMTISHKKDCLYLLSSNSKIYKIPLTEEGNAKHIEEIPFNLQVKPDNFVRSIYCDDQENLWVGKRNGLYFKKNGKVNFKKIKNSEKLLKGVRSIIKLKDDKYIIGAYNGIFKVSLYNNSITRLQRGKGIYKVNVLLKTAHNGILAGNNQGLWLLKHNLKPQFIEMDESKKRVSVFALLEDQFKSIWIGCNSVGIRYTDLKEANFQHVDFEKNDTFQFNYSRCMNEVDNYYIHGTQNGIHFVSKDFKREHYFDALNKNDICPVSAIAVSNSNYIIAGSSGYGLYISQKPFCGFKDLTFEQLKMPKELELPKRYHIKTVTTDKYENVWIATNDGGLYRYNLLTKKVKYIQQAKNISLAMINSMLYEENKDLLWLGTRNKGLLRLTLEGDSIVDARQYMHSVGNEQTISANFVYSIVRDKEGHIWAGTIGGALNYLVNEEEGIFKRYNHSNGFYEDDVEGLLVDNQNGDIWIAGTSITRFDSKTKTFTRYSKSDGIHAENGFKVKTDFKDVNGRLFFGGVDGLTYIDIGSWRKEKQKININIKEIQINHQELLYQEELNGRVVLDSQVREKKFYQLQPNEKDISIEFIGVSPSEVPKMEYSYKMEGYDNQWIKVSEGNSFAYYSNLSSGKYTFKVKGRLHNGPWSEVQSTYFEIEKPWWQRWYSIGLFVCIFILVIILINISYIHQHKLKTQLILAQSQREKDEELIEQKLEFFTNVGHDLRTPLTLMQGPLDEVVQNKSISPEIREKISLSYNQTNKLLRLVNELMDFRKFDKTLELKCVKFELTSFIENIYNSFRLKAMDKKITFQLDQPKEELNVYFDAEKIESVIYNLLSNAFKFTEENGNITIKVDVDSSDKMIKLKVIDDGLGIDENALDKIFDRFYQTKNANSINIKGTGLGLSIAKSVIEAHEGKIEVESRKGQGTTFIIELPLKETPNEEVIPQNFFVQQETNIEIKGSTFEKQTVLLVEDNEDILLYLSNLLKDTCTIKGASNGIEALEILKEDRNISLVVSDVMMPEMNGTELCHEIKTNEHLWHIPVFLLTAKTSLVHQLEGLETGADDYITKPFKPSILKQKVINVLKNKEHVMVMYQGVMQLQKPLSKYSKEMDDSFLEETISIVEKHLPDANLNVQLLVDEMGMSQSALYKKMKDVTGKSLVEFIKDVRMRKAGELLLSSNLKIFEIAYEIGFNDVKYFRKCFKEHYGMSASEYIKKMSEISEKQDMAS